jgi:hypothetical protein
MKLYHLQNSYSYAGLRLDGQLLDPTEDLEKADLISDIGPLNVHIDHINVLIEIKEGKVKPLPDFYIDDFIEYCSEDVAERLKASLKNQIDFVPVRFSGTALIDRSGYWEKGSLDEYPETIRKQYYAIHINNSSDILDENKTLMSTQLFGEDGGIDPRFYVRLVCKDDKKIPDIVALPGGTYGLLYSEDFVRHLKSIGLTGLRKKLVFDTRTEFERIPESEIPEGCLVTMANAWKLHEKMKA